MNNGRGGGGHGSSRGGGGRGRGGGRGGYGSRGRGGGGGGGGSWDSRGGGRARGGNGNVGGGAGGGGGRPSSSLPPAELANGGGPGDVGTSDAAPDTEPALRVLSFFEHGNRLSFACYREDRNEILFEDATSSGDGEDAERTIRGVLAECRPNLILVGNRVVANAPLLGCLTAPPPETGEDEDGGKSPSGRGGNDGGGEGVRGTAGDESRDNASGTATGPGEGDRAGANERRSIPYRLLKSSAFEPRQCKSIILTKLRVLTLMRAGGTATNSSGGGGNNFESFSHAQNFTPGNNMDNDVRYGAHRWAHPRRPTSAFHSLASIVDFDSPTLVRALGSLLSYLRNTAFRLEEGGTVTVSDVRRCSPPGSRLRLDARAARALRVFATERHPLSAHGDGVRGKGAMRGKEGFGLFALLDRTRSSAGRERLRSWMARPLRDVDEIRRRHAGIELFLHPASRPGASLMIEKLGNVGSVDATLLRMQRCACRADDYAGLGRMLDAAGAIAAVLGGEARDAALGTMMRGRGRGLAGDDGDGGGGDPMRVDDDEDDDDGEDGAAMDDEGDREQHRRYPSVEFVDGLLRRCHVAATRDLRERMATVIDEEATEAASGDGRVSINYGFHEELDRAKETFDALDETLSEVGRQVLAKHRELVSLKVVFLPQVGFLVSLDRRQHPPARHDDDEGAANSSFPGVPEDFEFVFLQDDDAFFKSDEMNALDEEIGDLDAFIKDTEAMILNDLEEEILERESELRSTFGALADLDCILSLAGCASDLGFVRPEVVPAEEGVIRIENGRHPLQELIVDGEFIPNDTRIDGRDRVVVVTGPNFSGKSCYARQVGVLVYLAHVGSYLPCDSARISVMDQILVNFGDVETCSVPQSTFQRDLTQMAGIMRKATPNTLVLIDEFGKGTAPTSGIAVMTSAVQRLARIGCKVVCTTHFLEMFSLGLLGDSSSAVGSGSGSGSGIKAVRMSIHVPESDEDDAVPLFKLEDGVASSSAGLVCARMAGLDRGVVDRASHIISALREGKQIRPLPESVNANSPFQPNVRSAIRLFLAVDSWADASDEDLGLLQELVDRM